MSRTAAICRIPSPTAVSSASYYPNAVETD